MTFFIELNDNLKNKLLKFALKKNNKKNVEVRHYLTFCFL